MLPTDFPQRNFIYEKPKDMTDEQCMSLPVWRGIVPNEGDEFPAIISCWKLSKEDFEEIQKTGCIWLSVTAMQLPPVSVFTEDPFERVKPEIKFP
jgi:hypothetical protein